MYKDALFDKYLQEDTMQIIISPAKKMRIDNDDLVSAAEPRFLKDTEVLLAELRKMQYDDLKKLWQCNDEIAALNYKRLQTMRLRANLTPTVVLRQVSKRLLSVKKEPMANAKWPTCSIWQDLM